VGRPVGETVILVLRELDPVLFVPLFTGAPVSAGRPRRRWAEFCHDRGCLVLAAGEADGHLAGIAVAESSPRFLHVLTLVGPTAARPLLLEHLLRRAGERGLHAVRPDLRQMLEAADGRQVRQMSRGCSWHLCRLDRDGAAPGAPPPTA
jgi:hypothetical protein